MEHCFVMNEVFWRFQKLSMIRVWAEKWDLQFGSGPRASRAQEIIKRKDILKKKTKNVLGRFGTLFCHEWGVLEVSEALDDTGLSGKMRSTIWKWSQSLQGLGNNKKKEILKKKNFKKWFATFRYIVLSWMRCFGGFRSARWYGFERKNEIYNLGVVPEPPELRK